MYNKTKGYTLIERLDTLNTLGKIIVTQKRNNFVVTITTNKSFNNQKVLFTVTPGIVGYKKCNRKHILAYRDVIKEVIRKIKKETNLLYFELIFKGICKGQQYIINGLNSAKINIFSITYEILYPKNGCKPRKQRRL